MLVRKNKDKIEISFAYDPKLIAFMKTLQGKKYNPGTKTWFIPLAGNSVTIEQLARKGFKIDPELLAAMEADVKLAQEAEAISILPDTEFESPLPLFPYQKVGASFLYQIGSGLMGDDMGLGKTIQSLAVAEKAQCEKVLIFCPASVKWQWAAEIEKFLYPKGAPEGEIVVVEGNKRTRELMLMDKIVVRRESWKGKANGWREKTGGRFFIVNYELLLRDFDAMDCREWDMIIADEATKISNAMAKSSKAIKRLRAKRRIAMTGTPVSNRANDVWNIIDFVQPGVLGNYFSFLQRYCLKNSWGGVFGYQHLDELQAKIKRYMIRRMKVDVLKELPEKITSDLPFELTDEEKDLYKKLKKEILFEIEAKHIAKIENPMTIQYTLVKMLRLRQLADSTELLGHQTKSSKMELLKEKLEEVFANNGGRKAIVFTQFAEMADILERELAEYKPLKISGSIKEEYSDVVKQFNDIEDHKVLVMTSAGQFGLNIQRASVIFHYDQEWSLAKMQQRDGRAHRFGQKDSVLVYNLLAKGTVDYYVKKIIHAKAELSNQVLGDVPISMGDIQEMLKYEL